MQLIRLTISSNFKNKPVVVEGAGAAGLAAILAGQLNEFQNKK